MDPFDFNGRYSPMSPPPPHAFFFEPPPLPPPPPRHHHRPPDGYPPPPPARRARAGDHFDLDPFWERDHRRPPTMLGFSSPGRKRVRWDQERAFEEHHRRLGFPDAYPRRDPVFDLGWGRPDPPVPSPRDGGWFRLGPNREAFVLDRQDEAGYWGSRSEADAVWHDRAEEGSAWRSWEGVAPTPSNRRRQEEPFESSRQGFVLDRVEESSWDRFVVDVERRPPPPPFRSYENLHPGTERAVDEELVMSSAGHGSQEERFWMNKEKRRMFTGSNSLSPSKTPSKRPPTKRPPTKKPSVLSRIQSGVSVWERIEEKPLPLRSPPQEGISEVQQPEMDHLDLSYKSNALVAKVLVPPNPVEPSFDEKAPVAESTKKKVVKKKVVKPREKVVVTVALNSPGSSVGKLVPKKLQVSGSPSKTGSPSRITDCASEKVAVVSSSIAAGTSGSSLGLKRAKPVASVGKTAMKMCTKTKGSVEDKQKEISTCVKGISSEIKPTDKISSEPCHQDNMVAVAAAQTIDTEQSSKDGSLVEIISTEVMRNSKDKLTGEKVSEICADTIAPAYQVQNHPNSDNEVLGTESSDGSKLLNNFNSDTSALSDFNLEQGTSPVMAQVGDGVANVPTVAIPFAENGINKDYSDESAETVLDIGNTKNFEIGLATPSRSSCSSVLADCEQVIASAVSPAPLIRSGSYMAGIVGQMGVGEEKQQCLEVGVVSKEFELLGRCASETLSSFERTHMCNTAVHCPFSVKDTVLESSPPEGIMDNSPNMNSLDGMLQLNSDLMLADSTVSSVVASVDRTVEHLMPSQIVDIVSFIGMSDGQDIGCHADVKQSNSWTLDLESCNDARNVNNQEEKLASKGDSASVSLISLVCDTEDNVKTDRIMQCQEQISEKLHMVISDESKKRVALGLKLTVGDEPKGRKSLPGTARVLSNKTSSVLKETAHSIRNSRSKTWHRSDNASSALLPWNPQSVCNSLRKQSPKKQGRAQNSYIRKGNSLIRKPIMKIPPERPPHDNAASSGVNRPLEMNCRGFDRSNQASSNSYFERPSTPPLPHNTKSPGFSADPPLDKSPDIPEGLITEASLDINAQLQPENPNSVLLSGSVDNQSIPISRSSGSSDSKMIRYVKPKSNQLVAAPGPEFCDSSIHSTEKAQKLCSFTSTDLYYRNKRNQLIRNTLSVQQKDDVLTPVDNTNTDDQRASNISSLKCAKTCPFKKRLDRALRKTFRCSKFSLVWTLSGQESQKKRVSLLNSWKVLPSLFPWKRTLYWKNYASNTAAIPNRHSLSLIGRKLQLARKRNMIYTVSTDGFSLRKAGVVSIGGSSLKWSKSIEKHSKKASEEATLAVAEVERMKRERKGTACFGSGKKRNCLPRERIFRVGSARYKMDSSRRTLIRIPDDHSLHDSDQQQSAKNGLKSFVPRRLLIGNDEYIRIGNGNQLVRDPKKLVRILASEKVRWSLHTARLKLAKKQQYCQFFTRFGKCNKNGGKCPYIHDPEKVAICTKFLGGCCSNTDCKLTHKILPERMPDCSYFLRGLCNNINCPYRHVNVNPKAAVCEGFLKGYCADGDECCKKHSYVCPIFEETGKCPGGFKCKLHHPKRKNKIRKRKRTTTEISSSKRRYFGSSITEAASKPLQVAPPEQDVKDGDLFFSDGQFADYISLDVISDGDDDGDKDAEASDLIDSSLSEKKPDDIDALLKPVRIMKKTNIATASN